MGANSIIREVKTIGKEDLAQQQLHHEEFLALGREIRSIKLEKAKMNREQAVAIAKMHRASSNKVEACGF